MRSSRWEHELSLQIAVARLPIPVREYVFAPPRKFRFDFAFPDKLLAVECDGGSWVRSRHTSGSGFEKDCEKFAIAAARGWRVIRVVPSQISSGSALRWLEEALKWAA